MEKFTRYRQTHIPEVKTPPEWKKETARRLGQIMDAYYRENLQGSEVINRDKGFRIQLSSQVPQ